MSTKRRNAAEPLRVLVVHGHPRPDSLGGALAAAYSEGAREAGCQVEEIRLSELEFNPDVITPSPAEQPLEPDLTRARRLLEDAHHIVFVYPNWWGTMPARLKGFLDRILLPGFAFREQDGYYYGLLSGRTAELITTMDVPPSIYRWVQGAPGQRAMRHATLGLCGIRVVRSTAFSPASHVDPGTIRGWVLESRRLGLRLSGGPLTRPQRAIRGLRSWTAAIRPQFFPMTLMAYTIGALLVGGPLSWGAFLLGLGCVVPIKAATVLMNDLFDRESDERNLNWSPFNGGGRSLQEGGLGAGSLWRGVGTLLGVSTLAALALLSRTDEPLVLIAILLPLTVMALSYTAPPLKLSHRGLGEFDVVLTHGPGVVVFAYVVQGGGLFDPVPWMVGFMIGLAILPAIILSGIPDLSADRSAGKKTLAVRLGTAGAARLAGAATVLSGIGAVLLASRLLPTAVWLPAITLPHAALLLYLLVRYLDKGAPERRIDALMVTALLYIGWFVVGPIAALL